MEFAQTIKQIRCRCLLSQNEFAKKIGVSFTSVNRWENGRSLPSFKALRSIDAFCKQKDIEFDAEKFSVR